MFEDEEGGRTESSGDLSFDSYERENMIYGHEKVRILDLPTPLQHP